ncbi:MAG: acyl-CoA dehydrogenase [Nocardioides sp.]|nr:acyl-CoA dehydrogenase [Nocardioides sp.]
MADPTAGTTSYDGTEFVLTDEQEAVRDLARTFADRTFDESSVRGLLDDPRGFDPAAWRALGRDLGVLGLALPTTVGGDAEDGRGHVELALLAEELGRVLAGVPLLGSVALAGTALARCGDDAAAAELLAGVLAGEQVLALAATDAAGRWAPEDTGVSLREGSDGAVLDGTVSHVVDGAAADTVLVVAQSGDGPRLVAVAAGTSPADGLVVEPLTTLDQTRRLARLTFSGTPGRVVGDAGSTLDAVAAARDAGALVLAAGAVGASAHLLATSVEYARTRLQFGRAIGSYQGVKHRCADMHVRVEESRSAAYHAAWTLDGATDDDVRTAVDLATVVTGEAFPQVAKDTVQVHGGIGFTWEHATHLYYKRAVGDAALLGGPAAASERLAASWLDATVASPAVGA